MLESVPALLPGRWPDNKASAMSSGSQKILHRSGCLQGGYVCFQVTMLSTLGHGEYVTHSFANSGNNFTETTQWIIAQ